MYVPFAQLCKVCFLRLSALHGGQGKNKNAEQSMHNPIQIA